MSKRRIWSEDEVIVLVALYSISKLQDGDDSSPLNKQIAMNFGRTRSTVDIQWRNIRIFQENGNSGDRTVSARLKRWIYQSNINRNEVLNIANRMCIKNGWKFKKLNQILGN